MSHASQQPPQRISREELATSRVILHTAVRQAAVAVPHNVVGQANSGCGAGSQSLWLQSIKAHTEVQVRQHMKCCVWCRQGAGLPLLGKSFNYPPARPNSRIDFGFDRCAAVMAVDDLSWAAVWGYHASWRSVMLLEPPAAVVSTDVCHSSTITLHEEQA
jgi:hypothetical protein